MAKTKSVFRLEGIEGVSGGVICEENLEGWEMEVCGGDAGWGGDESREESGLAEGEKSGYRVVGRG